MNPHTPLNRTHLLHFQILQNDRAHFTTEPSFRLLSFEITVSCLLSSHQRAGKSKIFISDWSTMTRHLPTNSSPPDLIPRFFGLSAASLWRYLVVEPSWVNFWKFLPSVCIAMDCNLAYKHFIVLNCSAQISVTWWLLVAVFSTVKVSFFVCTISNTTDSL